MANFLVVLLFVACFLVDSSVALRLSSRLVHRFSDEAKALWKSRNGNASGKFWPRRNSLKYFETLKDYDLKRRRLKIGSKYEVIFPSEGNEVVFFGNEFDWCSLLLGLSMMQDRDLSAYNPALSNTSQYLSCSHQLCAWSTTCKSPDDPCSYKRDYYTDNTSTSGFMIEDKLHLASFSKHGTQRLLQASVVLGCGRKQSGYYLDGAAPDGVMGLGPGNISVPTLLAKAGLVRNTFSLCFDNNGSGRILFGDNGPATQQTTQFLPLFGEFDAYFVEVESFCVGSSCLQKSGFHALVDSGSSFTYLPTEIYKKIVFEFDKQVKLNATRIILQEFPWNYCYNSSSLESSYIPSMKLVFPLNQSFIHDPVYTLPDSQGYKLFCLTLEETDDDYGVIGQNLMVGYRLVFDRENLQLGWSKSKCLDINHGEADHAKPPSNDGSPTALPTDGHLSPPNRQEIAPTAARAFSKSSLTAPHFSLFSCCCLRLFLLLFEFVESML
ncbi:aspartic proteinase-like protein 1 isoform X2 [Cucurbita pepo subsp. pepo]|uniref:aspartic proteinase-like protein 1 isoform X2 n=1 Tax=Cucurbita pepo subsp. pepo TaxID=3664 RepID=UPI000C9D471F|nr:aspartic proteinase-like protein 1 isoform X2 [Cucurbita pepo subsp. pepo]